jgi:hypothetical protein
MGFELKGQALEQAMLPTPLAGLGLRSAQALASIAFVSSQARSASRIDNDNTTTPTGMELATCLNSLRSQLPRAVKDLLPSTASAFRLHFKQHSAHQLQHALTAAMERHAFDRLLQHAGPLDRARLHAASAPKASLWITAAPTSPDTRLDNFTMRLSLRRLLGLPPSDIAPLRCRFCNQANGDMQLNPWHPISCPRLAGTLSTKRHNHVVDTISRWATRLGGYVTKPTKRQALKHQDKDVIPDFDLQLGPSRYIGDVTIPDPTAPSHVAKAAQGPLAVAAEAAKKKQDNYREHMRQLKPSATLVPFVVETYGGFGVEASNFIKDLIAQSAHFKSVWQPSELIHNIWWSISCAVQRENASIMRKALHSPL